MTDGSDRVAKQGFRTFKYAFEGLGDTWRSESNFRIQALAALLAILAGWALHISLEEWLWISLSIAWVLAAELFNTALEALVNLVSPQFHPLAKKAKDAAAAAVLMGSFFAIVMALLILAPKIWNVVQALL